MSPTPFADSSVPGAPRLEHVFSIKLTFGGIQNIQNMPSGAGRGAVYIAEGTVSGPRLNGRVLPGSGGDWALFRPDDTVATDALLASVAALRTEIASDVARRPDHRSFIERYCAMAQAA